MLYRKKNIPVDVEFAREAGCIQTLEGPVSYRSGDALLTGLMSERWPVTREKFYSSYSPLFPTLLGQSGKYIKNTSVVFAQPALQACDVPIGEGGQYIHAKIGDWLVTDPEGNRWVVAADMFLQSYAPEDTE